MKKLPKSIRKHIRKEKARIRRQFLTKEEQRKEIEKILNKKSFVRIVKEC
jgi:hypothetical protein